ncbi:MAG: hypothetical protein H8D45_01340 [Bacteroidetes bacterium]|nr:hypothetical protein [Bacteroidota bacterium]
MNFDKTFQDMFNAMFEVLKGDTPQIKDQLKYIIKSNKKKIERITKKLLIGKINLEEYEGLLRRNMKKIEDQLSTLDLMKDKSIQNAINAGIDVLMKAIKII